MSTTRPHLSSYLNAVERVAVRAAALHRARADTGQAVRADLTPTPEPTPPPRAERQP